MTMGTMKKGSVCAGCTKDLSGKFGVTLGDQDFCHTCTKKKHKKVGLFTADQQTCAKLQEKRHKIVDKTVKEYMKKLSDVNPFISAFVFESIAAHYRLGVEKGVELAKKHGR